MSTTPNHVVQSRAQLAEAGELADAGSTALARVHLRFAADHALFALAEIGAGPDDVAPVLRDLDDDGIDCMHDPLLAARLAAGFGLVQELIDAYIAHPASRSRHEAPARMPLYGGASGALNARGRRPPAGWAASPPRSGRRSGAERLTRRAPSSPRRGTRSRA